MSVKFSHRLEYVAARAACGLVMFLPYRVMLALAWSIMGPVWAFNRKLRARTHRRLRQALGADKSDRELARIARRAYRNLVFTAVEGMRMPGMSRAWIERNLSPAAYEELRSQLAPGQGFIVAVPHQGNWELAGLALQAQGVQLITLVRRQKNPLMNDWINRVRRSTGVEAIDTKSTAVGEVAAKLRAGKVLAILPDLRAKVGGVPVRYLGEGWTRIRWRLTGRVDVTPSADTAADHQRIMQAIMTKLEASVRANPESYFWFNKRWVLGPEEQR